MKQVSISEIQRNLHKLDSFDIVEVVDKKRDKVKGYFLDSKYLGFIKELIEKNNQSSVTNDMLAGSLHQYADLDRLDEEEGSWKKHVEKKYTK